VATHGTAVSLLKHSGDEQSAEVNLTLPLPLVVQVLDVGGNPVPNIPISFSWVSFPDGTGGHNLTPTLAVTDSFGRAYGMVTFGNRPGYYIVQAVAQGLSLGQQTFTLAAIPAAAVTLTSGNSQRAAVGTALRNPLVVTVTDQRGLPIEGTDVEFSIVEQPENAGGVSLSSPRVQTDSRGQASTELTLGRRVGTYKVRATWTALPGNPVDFVAFATAGAASQLSAVNSTTKNGIVGGKVVEPITVLVRDSLQNPVSDVPVEFSFGIVPDGAEGQSLSLTNAVTDSTGRASTELTLGNRAGRYSVLVTSSNLAGSPVEFSVVAVGASRLVVRSGDNQSAPISTQPEDPLTVALLDSLGNGISGAPILFSISLAPSEPQNATLENDTVLTNPLGEASTRVTLGNEVGMYRVSATALGFSSPPVEFVVSAIRAPAFLIERTAGHDQRRVVNSLLDTMKVTIKDADGVPIAGVGVSFSITSKPIGASGQRLSVTRSFTDAAGQASTVLTLGNRLGEYIVQAKSSGLPQPTTFRAVATAGAPASLVQSSGNHQRAAIKTTLPNALAVLVTDQGGNPVEGATVTFTVDVIPLNAQGHATTPGQSVTDTAGIARTTFTLGDKVGTYVITASSPALANKSVSFAVVATGGAPAFITHLSGTHQQAVINTTLPLPFSIVVRDSGNNPISGVRVTFAIDSIPPAAIGQALSVTNVITDGLGRASSYLTLGNKVGKYKVSASSSGLTGSPVRFEANATSDQSASLVSGGGNSQIAAVGTTLLEPFVVVASSGEGLPLPGVLVSFSVQNAPPNAQGHRLFPTSVTTDSAGRAVSYLTLGDVAGSYVVAASSQGLSGSPVTFNVMAVRSATISATDGGNQTGSLGSLLQKPFIVTVLDSAGNRLQGVRVRFSILDFPAGASGQDLSITTATTDFNGQASTLLRLGIRPGQYRVVASAPGMIGSPLSFYATATMIAGDANNDTQVNIADVTAVIDHILGRAQLSSTNQVRADMNGNGRIEVHDAVALVNSILESPSSTRPSVLPALSVQNEQAEGATPAPYQAQFELTAAGVRFILNNTQSLKGLQLVFRVKTGSNVTGPDVLFPRLEKMHVPVANRSGEVRVVIYNLENKEIEPGTGPILRLPVQVKSLDDIEILQVIASGPTNAAQAVATIKEVPSPGKYPQTFALDQNYPNPFNAGTTIRFEIPETPSMLVRAEMEIFDILGRKVRTLISGDYDVGRYAVLWDGRDDHGATVPSGVYFYRLKAVTYDGAKAAEVTGRNAFDKVFTKKMVMIK
ncbi:MAG TPA: Ig-like domain-containing protein, partial [Bacteroidota bacterium]|nr:Ig-like domain-containing protein [Bacteroidota bacterium]